MKKQGLLLNPTFAKLRGGRVGFYATVRSPTLIGLYQTILSSGSHTHRLQEYRRQRSQPSSLRTLLKYQGRYDLQSSTALQ